MNTEVFGELAPEDQLDLLWTPDKDGFAYPDAVERVAYDFNHTPYNEMLRGLQEKVRRDDESGIQYAIWDGDETDRADYSKTDAMVMYSTFASSVDNNMLLRGEFCHRVINELDLRDDQGKKLPLVFFGAPANEATLPVDKAGRAVIASGDLAPAAEPQLQLVKELGYGRVALIGFSQGGSMAAASAREAHTMGLDVSAIGAASNPNVKKRLPVMLQGAFMAQGKHLRGDIERGGLDHFKTVHDEEYSELKYFKAMMSQAGINLALFRGMSRNRFQSDIEQAMKDNNDLRFTTAVAIGDHDNVGPEKATRVTVQNLRHKAREIQAPLPRMVTIENGNHSWGDRVKLLSTFYGFALAQAYDKK